MAVCVCARARVVVECGIWIWQRQTEKKKREEEFEKESDELLMRIEMSRAKEPWLMQCWKREINKCVKKEQRSSKGLSEEELIAMIE